MREVPLAVLLLGQEPAAAAMTAAPTALLLEEAEADCRHFCVWWACRCGVVGGFLSVWVEIVEVMT